MGIVRFVLNENTNGVEKERSGFWPDQQELRGFSDSNLYSSPSINSWPYNPTVNLLTYSI